MASREFRSALLFKDSVLVDRIFQVFDRDDDGEICFQEYVACLSILSLKASSDEKLQCKPCPLPSPFKAIETTTNLVAFQIYDFDGDGLLSVSDLTAVVAATLR